MGGIGIGGGGCAKGLAVTCVDSASAGKAGANEIESRGSNRTASVGLYRLYISASITTRPST
jgi:hypothetical protein